MKKIKVEFSIAENGQVIRSITKPNGEKAKMAVFSSKNCQMVSNRTIQRWFKESREK